MAMLRAENSSCNPMVKQPSQAVFILVQLPATHDIYRDVDVNVGEH